MSRVQLRAMDAAVPPAGDLVEAMIASLVALYGRTTAPTRRAGGRRAVARLHARPARHRPSPDAPPQRRRHRHPRRQRQPVRELLRRDAPALARPHPRHPRRGDQAGRQQRAGRARQPRAQERSPARAERQPARETQPGRTRGAAGRRTRCSPAATARGSRARIPTRRPPPRGGGPSVPAGEPDHGTGRRHDERGERAERQLLAMQRVLGGVPLPAAVAAGLRHADVRGEQPGPAMTISASAHRTAATWAVRASRSVTRPTSAPAQQTLTDAQRVTLISGHRRSRWSGRPRRGGPPPARRRQVVVSGRWRPTWPT